MARKLEKFGNGIVRVVELADLQIDMEYQRELRPSHKRMADYLDPMAVGVLHVGNRGEQGLFCIDGQQRREALLLNHIARWQAFVIPSSGAEFEAVIYRRLNEDRKPLTVREKFKACLASGDANALATVRAVKAAGLKINPSASKECWPGIACIGMLYRQAKSSEAVLTRALKLIAATWPQQGDSLRDLMIGGVCQLCRTYGNDLHDATFVEAARLMPTEKIINATATSHLALSNRSSAAANVLLAIYNKKAGKKNALKIHVEDTAAPAKDEAAA